MRHHIQGPERFYPYHNHRRGNKIFVGLIIVLVGILMLFRKLGYFFIDFHTFWPLILIAIGLIIGFKTGFRRHAWWILILVGIAYSIPEFEVANGVWSSNLMVPLGLIIGGLMIALRPGKKNHWKDRMQVITNTEGAVNIDITFAGRKEIVTSKEFRGGNISTTFGGCELNLSQADSSVQPMVLNFKVSFGGVELIVPSHWEIVNEIETSVGSVEDHRTIRMPAAGEEKKTLILKGSCSFGSIEIKSY
jgi:hypothetical protein